MCQTSPSLPTAFHLHLVAGDDRSLGLIPRVACILEQLGQIGCGLAIADTQIKSEARCAGSDGLEHDGCSQRGQSVNVNVNVNDAVRLQPRANTLG